MAAAFTLQSGRRQKAQLPQGVRRGWTGLKPRQHTQRCPSFCFAWARPSAFAHPARLYYRDVRGSAAEVFHFDDAGKVTHAIATYIQAP